LKLKGWRHEAVGQVSECDAMGLEAAGTNDNEEECQNPETFLQS
jgi:hypothetical protein